MLNLQEVSDYFPEFLNYSGSVVGAAETTVEAYGVDLRVFARFVSDREYQALNLKVIEAFFIYCQSERGNSKVTIDRKYATLKAFFDFLVVKEVLSPKEHPLHRLPPRRYSFGKKLPKVLSETEVEKLLDAIPTSTAMGIRDYALISTAYGLGLRASEVLGIRLEDFDWEFGSVRIDGKGGNQRILPLPPELIHTLQIYLKTRKSDSPHLFYSKKSRRMTPRNLQMMMKKYARRAGLSEATTPHTLRHSMATHSIQNGAEIFHLADFLGHASVSATQLYVHLSMSDLISIAENHPVNNFTSLPMITEMELAALRYQEPYTRTEDKVLEEVVAGWEGVTWNQSTRPLAQALR